MKRLECLDGLRGLLAMYVLLVHLAPFAVVPGWIASPFLHGQAAVDIFFILSGLVIVQSLETLHWDARRFLVARGARILPVYFAMFGLAVAVQALPTDFASLPWIELEREARETWSVGWPPSWLADISAHLTMTHGLLPDAVLPAAWISILGSAWSLSTECQFYVLALLIGARVGSRRMIGVFLALGACGVIWHVVAPQGWQFSRAFLPHKAHFFALGIASAGMLHAGAREVRLYGATMAATLSLCLLQGGVAKLGAPVFWTLCLTAQIRPGTIGLAPLVRILRAPTLLRLGAMSYCIYLANEPVQKLLGLALAGLAGGDGRWFTTWWLIGGILLPLAASAWLHEHLEVPWMRWGRALSKPLPPAGAIPSVASTRKPEWFR